MSDKYYWGFTRHEMTNLSDSISDCIKEAKEMKGLDFVPRFIYVGECKTYVPEMSFGWHILEYYGDEAECYDSNWLEDVSDEDEALLDEMLNEAFKKWCKKTGNEPNFGTIENIKKYSFDTGKEIKGWQSKNQIDRLSFKNTAVVVPIVAKRFILKICK